MSKEDERMHFRRFQDTFADCPKGIVCEGESPDFILRTSQGFLGIEHTQIFEPMPESGPPRQARENSWQQTVDGARALHEASGGGALDVAVMFQVEAILTRKRMSELAAIIAEFAGSADLSKRKAVRFEPTAENYQTFPPELNFVRVFHYGPDTAACWVVQDAAYVASCTRDLVQERLGEKDARLDVYRRKCDEVWVLLVLDGFHLSSMLPVPDETVSRPYDCAFDRAFLFDNCRCRTWELRVQQGGSGSHRAG